MNYFLLDFQYLLNPMGILQAFFNFAKVILFLKFYLYFMEMVNPLVPSAPFLYPLKTFSKGSERVHWEQIG